jgi:hypothetical protein
MAATFGRDVWEGGWLTMALPGVGYDELCKATMSRAVEGQMVIQ